MQYTSKYVSPIGDILLASDGAHLTGLWSRKTEIFCRHPFRRTRRKKICPFSMRRNAGSIFYFSAAPIPVLCRLYAPRAHPFRQKVWDILLQIPRGSLLTYKEIADKNRRQKRPSPHVRPGGRRRGRTQSDFHPHPLSQSGWQRRQPDRMRRRHREKIALLKLEGAYTSRLKLPKKGPIFKVKFLH